ncbi:MAG: hypothetical protein L6R42_004242 [Xanthoria sp. 1 TBL-2021]|nr:MAG: hypothetical protein L6R42_004242 [Xanthoria sp. 1 TBL-2021]
MKPFRTTDEPQISHHHVSTVSIHELVPIWRDYSQEATTSNQKDDVHDQGLKAEKSSSKSSVGFTYQHSEQTPSQSVTIGGETVSLPSTVQRKLQALIS